MYRLPDDKKKMLAKNIRYHLQKCFPGKGSGIRLAGEIGTTPQTLSNWLNGTRIPNLCQIYLLAKAFDVSPLELCGARQKDTLNPKVLHISVLTKLLNHCEKDIVRNVNPRVTRKFMNEVKVLVENLLCVE